MTSSLLSSLVDKQLYDLTASDLNRVIATTQGAERADLEFKAFAVLRQSKDKIGKTVSALANAEGGVLLIGVTDGGALDWGSIEEWPLESVEAVLRRKIDPLPQIRCHPIRSSKDQTRVVYAAEISASKSLVAFDNRYYMRVGTSSLPMPPYQVEREMMRRSSPELSLSLFRFREGGGGTFGGHGVYVILTNSGTGPARHPYVLLKIGQGIDIDDYGSMSYAGLRGAGRAAQWIGETLLPQTSLVVSGLGISVTQQSHDGLNYMIGAESAAFSEGEILVPDGFVSQLPNEFPLLVADGARLCDK